MIKCLSTNELLLSEKAEKIIDVGVRTLTLTVNAVQPEIVAKLCSGIIVNNRMLQGVEAARYLIDAQIAGIKKITSLGAVVKINIVLAVGINNHHIGEISETVARAGASMVNIIPLIPQNELSDHTAPDCDELQHAREAAEKYLHVFKHCKQCRADAVGIPGVSEFRHILYSNAPLAFSHG